MHHEETRRNSQKAFAQLAAQYGFEDWELQFDPMQIFNVKTGQVIKLPKKATFNSALKALIKNA